MIPRLTSRALPEVRFVPGRGRRPEPQSAVAADELAYGIDLFHHGFLWEAHEAWEGLWRAAPRGSTLAHGLRGLIQCAAGALKAETDRPQGLVRLAAKAQRELALAGAELEVAGLRIDLARFAEVFEVWVAEGAEPDRRPQIPVTR